MRSVNYIFICFLFFQFIAKAQSGKAGFEAVNKSVSFLVRDTETKEFHFKDLQKMASSKAGEAGQLTLDLCANPLWFGIEAIPYLMTSPAKTNDEYFDHYFVCSVARDLKVYDSAILNKKMFLSILALQQSQLPDGSWPWIKGMKGDRTITGMICAGIGRLENMHIYNQYTDQVRAMGVKAFLYLDSSMKNDYDKILKNGGTENEPHLTPEIVTYLYARTSWRVTLEHDYTRALFFWIKQGYTHWQDCNLMEKAMLVSAMHREGEDAQAAKIWHAIDAQALQDKETGIWWKENINGPGLFERPIETECMLIEAYNIILRTNMRPIEEMTQWLIQQRNGHSWPTSSSTADAVFALMITNKLSLSNDRHVLIRMGDQVLDTKTSEPVEQDGVFSHTWDQGVKKPGLSTVKIENKGNGIVFGLISLQYLEKYKEDKKLNLRARIEKKICHVINNGDDEQFVPVSNKIPIKKGDTLAIVIDIYTDRDLEYVYVNDSLNAGFSPVDLSPGYTEHLYMGIKHSLMQFYLDHLSKDSYEFDYEVVATGTGTFDSGIAKLKCMYAPEYERRSKSEKLKIDQ